MDAVSSARTARESLARGLAALQSPGLPPEIMSVADPVAQAMGALHRIESSAGAALHEAAPAALAFVRQALGMLQAQSIQHPAIDQGASAIAGSLGIVHQLSQLAAAPAAPVVPAVSAYAGPMVAGAGSPAPLDSTQRSTQGAYGTRPEPQPQVAVVHAPPVPAPYVPQAYAPPAAPAYAAPQPAAYAPPAAPAYAAPAAPAFVAPQPAAYVPQQPAQPAPAPYGAPPATPGTGQRVEAALGAHSATNFYKGLSGNDVIESGGIFIATYQIPTIGTQLLIHVSLPGGYEFEAQAIVRWTREAPNSGPSGHDAPPGFGAQFTQVTQEARQLVYRYVRNREPLFHDDL